MRNRKKQKGLTLPEIMIALSIAAMLTSMAFTSFSDMVRKQRKAEARTLLGDLFGQMTNFHTEWGSYWGRFKDIPFVPVGFQLYDVGFQVEGPPPVTNPLTGITFDPLTNVDPASTPDAISSRTACGVDLSECDASSAAPLNIGNLCTWDQNTFTACAEGHIGGASTDQWTIDQIKTLTNIRDGSL